MLRPKTTDGNFFEDFTVGHKLPHPIPRTLTDGDVALNTALYGSRHVFNCADPFAQRLGLTRAPVDDLLVFHVVAGKSVTDISLNAVANLGYADMRFHALTYPGDTLGASSRIVGLKQNSDGKTGIVYLHTTGLNQHGKVVVDYMRWVMVHKRDHDTPAPAATVPELPDRVAPESLYLPPALNADGYDTDLSGAPHLWDDYEVGEKIDHVDGVTIEEAEHVLATKQYQNTARVHLDAFAAKSGRWGRRLIVGSYIISLARALSHNGLANAFKVAAINGATHVAPAFAGYTIYAWSKVLEKAEMPNRADFGALRLRTIATNEQPCAAFPSETGERKYDASVLLDWDYWVLIPRR